MDIWTSGQTYFLMLLRLEPCHFQIGNILFVIVVVHESCQVQGTKLVVVVNCCYIHVVVV